ncbi:hypothetical protein FPSE_05422 [Fusarium pseudograminearum CS3096]|uniref:BTB domain-containing protein n=1 Tax=Fusarium pseudograminearum (strain CS3096) TaxID=1028729 RepID=K3W0M6_FUSPC|nr:hypothetical protein FPSE_05422 [Fusarium pseudograminearum CS3096]EKJ74415.1 hypothetical protein FPSE_05422 [Fusarium pseudograminearum CS3096]
MMTSITYEIDPGGDVELVLESPNKQQIVPIIKYKEDENYRVSMFDGDSDHFFENSFLVGRYAVFNIEEEDHAMEEDGQETNTANSRSDELIEVRMRVSSRHLILASRTFRTMLEGPWSENLSRASQSQSGPVQVVTSDWDAAALAIVLDAIHGRYQEIPKNVSIGLMTRIATIVDYYECHECLQLISDIWISDVYEVHGVADTFCKSSLLWLYISWVFSKRNIMDPTSRMLLQETLDLSQIDLKDLPLGQILGLISQYRLIMNIALTQDRKN